MSNTKRIREELFQLSQKKFGIMLGISQSVVSDMEKNDSLASAHQKTVREEAKRRGLTWRDGFFFKLPKDLKSK